MVQTFHSDSVAIDINRVADGTLEDWTESITISKVLVGAVMEVRITHPEMVAQIDEIKFMIPAATVSVNTEDVVTATTYYCYYKRSGNDLVFEASTTHPDVVSPAIEYVWVRVIRFKSITGVATIEFVQRQLMAHDEALHSLAEYAYLLPPVYISGFAPTFSLTTGTLSVEAGKYRRLTGDMRSREAITNGVIYEPVVDTVRANFMEIVKYSDGSAITSAKYVKLLVGVLVNATSDYDFIVNIQAKPAVEYATAADAWADSERKASTGFSTTRRSAVLPLCWLVMKKGDASTIVYQDIRETGLTTAYGGSSGVTDHGALSGLSDDDHLNYLNVGRHDVTSRHGALVVDHGSIGGLTHDDHTQYLLADGTRTLSGNLTVAALATVDGVDISAHALANAAHEADADAHHARVTLDASAGAILGLSTQQITLDTQTANTVLAGPTSGAAAAPTFRTVSSADISDFTEAAQDAVGAMVANSNSVALTYTDGTPALEASVVWKEATLTLSNGVNNNIVVTGGDLFIVSGPTAAFTIAGIAGGSSGRQIIIHNQTSERMTIAREALTSTAANRIYTGTGGDITTASGAGSTGSATLTYSSTLSRWIVSSWIA